MGKGDLFALACVILMAIETVCLVVVVIVSLFPFPAQAEAIEFRPSPKDRPVLETVQQVWKAQTTGISDFHLDGVHYIIKDLPRNYVAYSSWYCRMP